MADKHDRIYYFENHSERKDVYYEFQIVPANSTTALDRDTCEYELLENEVVYAEEQIIDSEFVDKFLIGIAAADSISINFNLKYASEDFQDIIFESPTDYITAPNLSNCLYLNTLQVNRVTTDGGDIPIILNKECIGVFVQEPSLEMAMKISHEGIKTTVQFINIAKYILQNINANMIASYYNVNDDFITYFGIDIAINYPVSGTAGVKHIFAATGADIDTATLTRTNTFRKIKSIDDAIILYANEIYYKLLRIVAGSYINLIDNPFIALTYYKQKFETGSSSNYQYYPGAALTYDQLYLHNNFFLPDSKNGLYEYENAWDYWQGCCENNVCKLVFDYNFALDTTKVGILNMRFLRIFDSNVSNDADRPTFLFSNIEGDEFEITQGSLKIKGSKANLNFGDDDKEEFIYQDNGSMSQEEFEIKTMFTNTMQMVTELGVRTSNFPSGFSDCWAMFSPEIYANKIYYKTSLTSPNGLWGDGNDNAVSPYCLMSINDGISTYYNTLEEYERLFAAQGKMTKAFWDNIGVTDFNTEIVALIQNCNDLLNKVKTITTLFNKDYYLLEVVLHRGEADYDHHYYPKHLGDKIPVTVPSYFVWFDNFLLYNKLVEYMNTKDTSMMLHKLSYDFNKLNVKVSFIWG